MSDDLRKAGEEVTVKIEGESVDIDSVSINSLDDIDPPSDDVMEELKKFHDKSNLHRYPSYGNSQSDDTNPNPDTDTVPVYSGPVSFSGHDASRDFASIDSDYWSGSNYSLDTYDLIDRTDMPDPFPESELKVVHELLCGDCGAVHELDDAEIFHDITTPCILRCRECNSRTVWDFDGSEFSHEVDPDTFPPGTHL